MHRAVPLPEKAAVRIMEAQTTHGGNPYERKVLLLLAIMAAVSLSACTDNPISTGDKPGMEAAASTASTEESRNADEALICTELQLSSSEQVARAPPKPKVL